MSRTRRRWLRALSLLVAGCANTDEIVAVGEQGLHSDVAGIGPLNGIEWQIDAPWRMEPANGTYDKIPLITTIHDARIEIGAPPIGERISLGRLCGVYVVEDQEVTLFEPTQLHEIEASKRWLNSGDLEDGPSSHQLRRIWSNESPEPVLQVGDWAEWHATAMYQPHQTTPGTTIGLIVLARIASDESCSPNPPMDRLQALWQLEGGRESNGGYPPLNTPLHAGPLRTDVNEYYLGEFLKVHLAAAPLPKFDARWAYGDLHYHSQGTDNEGESGINYRGVIQAMKAMGLDYVFATEHASSSHQITGIHQTFVNALPFLPDWASDIEDYIVDALHDAGIGIPILEADALRDMSAQRFRHLHDWLNGSDGVNAQVQASGGSARRPQIFLGGEVDVIPEISDTERQLGFFRYAGDRTYAWSHACSDLPAAILAYFDLDDEFATCEGRLIYSGAPDLPNQYAVRDVQGIGEVALARQHLVYLPYDAGPGTVRGREAFIPSDTTTFGGATKYLSLLLHHDLAVAQKGYVFLAHPVDAASGAGVDRIGPDIVPYSDTQLRTAFRSQHVLGLQLWNEDERQDSSQDALNFPLLHGQGVPSWEEPRTLAGDVSFDWGWERQALPDVFVKLNRGARMWDQMLRWGITPARTSEVGWVVPGAPRKVFMAGGSDAHGDLNYRRSGRFQGLSAANDTAIGKPRNLTFLPGASTSTPVGQNQVIDGLRSGQFTVTDGPALRIAVDVNHNGVVDDQDIPMGGDFAIGQDSAPILVEWKSTPEFGPVASIDLYVGVQGGSSEGLVYAPVGHGTAGSGTCIGNSTIVDGTGRVVCPMTDGYVRDPTGALRLAIAPANGMSGTRQLELHPSTYRVFEKACISGVCTVFADQHPQRLYVRAFARTSVQLGTLSRFAFTNPIWMTATPIASPPNLAIQHVSCDVATNTNTFALTVTEGVVPGTMSSEIRLGTTGAWTAASTQAITAPGGLTVFLRGRACNAMGCSAEAITQHFGPTCLPPAPSPPSVSIEHLRCASGTNTFDATVIETGTIPTTSMIIQSQVASGNWVPVTGSISAGSKQRVSVRAKACNGVSCSAFASASLLGPTCSTGGGGPAPP